VFAKNTLLHIPEADALEGMLDPSAAAAQTMLRSFAHVIIGLIADNFTAP
jgi:hypothetical protein